MNRTRSDIDALIANGDLVWTNGDGGQTFRVPGGYLKTSTTADLRLEAEKTRWVGRYIEAARVVDAGSEQGLSWMLTEALPSNSFSVPERCTLIGRSLRAFHESLPLDQCPWEITLAERQGGRHHGSIDQDLVVTHGDACVPNMVAGVWIDLGDVAVSDRWYDVTVACLSVDWPINFGPGHARYVLDGYLRAPSYPQLSIDQAVLDFYTDLYEVTIGFPPGGELPGGADEESTRTGLG